VLEATARYNDGTFIPLALKTNKVYQASTNSLDVTTKKYNEENQLESQVTDLRVKTLQAEELQTLAGTLNLNNFGDGNYTKITFEEVLPTQLNQPYATLNTLIPEGKYGLLMMYNNKQDPNGKGVALRFNKDYLTLEVKSKRV
jgi:hypothetical protein